MAYASVFFASVLLLSVNAALAAPALPRQFSVEVAPGGVLFADGTRLGAFSELTRWAQRAVSGARFSGAVVFGDPARDGPALAQAVEVLQKAGFSEVRSVGRPAPVALSAARPAGTAPLVSANPRPAPLAASSATSAAGSALSPARSAPSSARPGPSGPAVTLASMGMRADGAINREPHRGRILRLIEREFPAFKRCHGRASAHDQGASYGVDLLIPTEGGRAKVRETRTRLDGTGFKSCMRDAFEAIRFPKLPSERPEIISYSVVFKPGGR